MDFEKAVSLVGTVTDLRRIASAHVIDPRKCKMFLPTGGGVPTP